MKLHAKANLKVAGYYRLQVMRDGKCKHDTGWFRNLITNQGLDWVGFGTPVYLTTYGGNYLNTHCGVGTGTTPPSYTDTTLTAPLAMYPAPGSNVEGGTLTYVAGPPPYWSCIWTYSFATGAVVGNLTEVGVGGISSGTATTPQLFSHALILDGSGNPTTLPVTSADALQVTYELRYYIDTTDNSYSMNISGTTYTGTYRRMQITTVPGIYFPVFGAYNGSATYDVIFYAYSGFSLGPITGNPSYSSTTSPSDISISNTAYVSGTYYCEFTSFAGLTVANFAGGLTGFSTSCNHGQYQFSVSPAIPKTSSYTLSIVWHVSWSRYP